jgi:hypothetical protein
MSGFEIPKICNSQKKIITLKKEIPAFAESIRDGCNSALQKRPVNCSDQ